MATRTGVRWPRRQQRAMAKPRSPIRAKPRDSEVHSRPLTEDDLLLFRLAMDNSADMIVLLDRATMSFVDINNTTCRLLGYTRQELLAKRPEELLPFTRKELETAYDRQIADPSTPGSLNSYYRCKD